MWEYKFETLEDVILDTSTLAKSHCEIDLEKINKLGKEGFELIQVVMINDVQCGWFKKKL